MAHAMGFRSFGPPGLSRSLPPKTAHSYRPPSHLRMRPPEEGASTACPGLK
jgi:hypothetical protein